MFKLMNKSYYRVLVFNLDKFILWLLTGVDGSSKWILKMFSSLFPSSLEYYLFLWDLASAYILTTTRAAILKSS